MQMPLFDASFVALRRLITFWNVFASFLLLLLSADLGFMVSISRQVFYCLKKHKSLVCSQQK